MDVGSGDDDISATSETSTSTETSPHDNDLICGRGGKVNAHPGNKKFRTWVAERKERYTLAIDKGAKLDLAKEILSLLRSQSPPGRVLKYDSVTGLYEEVDEKKALTKTTQALREGAPLIRKAKGLPPAPLHGQHKGTKPNSVHLKPSSKKKLTDHNWHHGGYDEDNDESSMEEEDRHISRSTFAHHIDETTSSRSYDASEESDDDPIDHNMVSYHGNSGYRKHDLSAKMNGNSNTTLSKKPRIIAAGSSDDEHVQQQRSSMATPPATESANLLYALATTATKEVSQAAAASEVSPDMHKGPMPKFSLSTYLQNHTPDEQLAILRSIRAGSGRSPSGLTPSQTVRFEKEKIVQEWLISSIPALHTDDVRAYTRQLVDDGFDSLPMLTEQLEDEDLNFMKKAHKRALLKIMTAKVSAETYVE